MATNDYYAELLRKPEDEELPEGYPMDDGTTLPPGDPPKVPYPGVDDGTTLPPGDPPKIPYPGEPTYQTLSPEAVTSPVESPTASANPYADFANNEKTAKPPKPAEPAAPEPQQQTETPETTTPPATPGQAPYVPGPAPAVGTTPPPPPPPPPAPPPPPQFPGSSGMPQLGELPQFEAPAAPEQTGMYGDLESYVRDWMANPNAYLSDLAQQQRAASKARLAEMEANSGRQIGEWAGERGLIGSSYEGEQQNRLQDQLYRAAAEDEAALLDRIVGAEAQGRQAAFAGALNVAQLDQNAKQFRAQYEMQAAQYGHDAAFRAVQLQQQDSVQRAQLDLSAAIAGDQAAMQRVGYELDVMRAMDQATLSRSELELRSQQLELTAYQIREALLLQGQQIGEEQARWIADLELRKQTFEEQKRQYDQTFAESNRRYEEGIKLEYGTNDLDSQYGPKADAISGMAEQVRTGAMDPYEAITKLREQGLTDQQIEANPVFADALRKRKADEYMKEFGPFGIRRNN